MTFEAQTTFVVDTDETATASSRTIFFPQHEAVADPCADWASQNPDRLMAFLLVTPRDCSAIDAVMAR